MIDLYSNLLYQWYSKDPSTSTISTAITVVRADLTDLIAFMQRGHQSMALVRELIKLDSALFGLSALTKWMVLVFKWNPNYSLTLHFAIAYFQLTDFLSCHVTHCDRL